MRGDLHVHTNISDGSFNIDEILRIAKEEGLTHIGITNHDTVNGLTEAIELGKEFGIKVIPGIEISAYDFQNNRKVHILGYNFNLQREHIRQICDPILKKRNRNSMVQMEKIINEGYDLDVNYIKSLSISSEVIYKQHIMQALIQKHYTDKIYSDLYKRIFKNNGVCASGIDYVDVYKAVEAIVNDGGIAILAHPGHLNSYDIIPELVSKGLRGIEINHHSHTEEDKQKIRSFAEDHNLILTGGTDFHGSYGENNIKLGEIESPTEYLDVF